MLGIEEGINSYTAASVSAEAAPNLSDAYFGTGRSEVSGLTQQSIAPTAELDSPISLATESFSMDRGGILMSLVGDLGLTVGKNLVIAPIKNGFEAMFREPQKAAA